MRTRNVIVIKAKHRHFWVLRAGQKEKELWNGILVDDHFSSNLRKKKGSWPNYGPHCNWLSMTRLEIDYLVFDNIYISLHHVVQQGDLIPCAPWLLAKLRGIWKASSQVPLPTLPPRTRVPRGPLSAVVGFHSSIEGGIIHTSQSHHWGTKGYPCFAAVLEPPLTAWCVHSAGQPRRTAYVLLPQTLSTYVTHKTLSVLSVPC